MFNLLPVYPLDGGQIAREILLKFSPAYGIRQSLVLSMSVAVVLAVVGAVQCGEAGTWPCSSAIWPLPATATLQAYSGRRPVVTRRGDCPVLPLGGSFSGEPLPNYADEGLK